VRNEIIDLIQFVLESAAEQPIRKRIVLYRGLARICGEEREARQLNRMADDLQESEKLHAELIFSFSQKT
jgi:hypothetical protein